MALVKNRLAVLQWLLLPCAGLLALCGTALSKVDSGPAMPSDLLGLLRQAAAIPQQRAPLVAVAPQANFFALAISVGAAQERLLVWSLPGETLQWQAEANGVQSIRFAKNSAQLLTAHVDGSARVWDAKTGQKMELDVGLVGGKKPILYDAVFLGGDQNNGIAVVGQNGLVGVWDSIQKKWFFAEGGHRLDVLRATSFEGGKKLLTLDEGQFCLWDITPGSKPIGVQCIRHDVEDPNSAKEQRASVYQNPVFNNLVATLSPDEQLLVLAKDRGVVQVWDLQQKIALAAFQQGEHVPFGFFSGDGRWMARFQQTHFALENGKEVANPSLVVEDVHAYRNRDGTLHFRRGSVHQTVFRTNAEPWLLGVRGWSMLVQEAADRVMLFDPEAPQDKPALGPHVVNGIAWVLSKELPPAPEHGWVRPVEPEALVARPPRRAAVSSPEMGVDGKPLWVVDPEKGILRNNDTDGSPDADTATIQMDSLQGVRRVLVSPSRNRVLVLGPSDAQLFEKKTTRAKKDKKRRNPTGAAPVIRRVWQRALEEPARYVRFAPRGREILWAAGIRMDRVGAAKGNLIDTARIEKEEEIQLVNYESRPGWVFVWTNRAVHWRAKTGRWKTRPGSVAHFSVHRAGIVIGDAAGKFALIDPVRNVDKAVWVLSATLEVDRFFLSGNGKWAVVYSSKANKMLLWQLGSKESRERGTMQLDEGDMPKQVRFLPGGRAVELTLLSGKARWYISAASEQAARAGEPGKN